MVTRRHGRTFGPILVLLLGAATAPAQERDLWYAMSQGETRWGSNHTQVTRSDDGQLKFRVETRVLVNFLGQRQEIRYVGEHVTSESLRPISLQAETGGMSGKSTIRAELVGDTLHITSIQQGEESRESFAVDPSRTLLLDACLGEWLAQQAPDADGLQVQVIEDSSFQVSTVTATRVPDPDGLERWRVEDSSGDSLATIVVADDGFERARDYAGVGIRLERCSAEEAADLEYRDQTGREVLTFPLDRDIPAPHRLTELTVELRWQEIPIAEFELEDDRQRLVLHTEEDGASRAVVKISSPAPMDPVAPFPLQVEGLELFLAETDFIKPDDPSIREVAREVVEGESTALGAVRALSAWVHGSIDGALIAETLSGPEVLARKTGKCTEYSTLFASLARSVGIPTRVALGERMVNGYWGGHMWNEAYVGRWIPVDASANEVGESFALLKFIHSDTVTGTQPLRWKLVESLEIHIQDFQVGASPLASHFQTGIEGGVYTNVDYECRLTAPAGDWTLEDQGNTTIRFQVPGAGSVFIHFVAFDLPAGTPAKQLTDARIEMFRPNYRDFDVTRNEPIDVQGSAGHSTCFHGFAEDSEVESCITEFVWTHKTFGYLLNMIATREEHDETLVEFEHLLARFEFLSAE